MNEGMLRCISEYRPGGGIDSISVSVVPTQSTLGIAGIKWAGERRPPIGNDPEARGWENVVLFGAAILRDEEKGMVVPVRAGVEDLEWVGDKY